MAELASCLMLPQAKKYRRSYKDGFQAVGGGVGSSRCEWGSCWLQQQPTPIANHSPASRPTRAPKDSGSRHITVLNFATNVTIGVAMDARTGPLTYVYRNNQQATAGWACHCLDIFISWSLLRKVVTAMYKGRLCVQVI
jgi:hypothetical protein